MTPELIDTYLLENFPGLVPGETWGEISYFYNPDNALPRGTYFFTLKKKNGDNDKASALDRNGVYRINFGLPKPKFFDLFEEISERPAKGKCIDGAWDFTALDILTPHPIYGWMGWVAILNPTKDTFDDLAPLLEIAYNKSVRTFEKRVNKK